LTQKKIRNEKSICFRIGRYLFHVPAIVMRSEQKGLPGKETLSFKQWHLHLKLRYDPASRDFFIFW